MTSFLLTSLNLLLLYRGTLTIPPGYSISMPKKVLVEINHCTDVPCMFTTPERYSKSSAPFYIYWFKSIRKRYYLVWINMWVPGYLMVTNDLRQKAEITNFKLIGDPKNGDCSFSIANAQPVDSGKYYMRIDKGSGFRYAFESSAPQHHVNPQIVVRDVKKPMIWKPPSIIWGETIHFSCVASNSCLNPKPKILWSIKSNHWNMSDWATQKSNWTWTYGTNLSFVPSLANEGLILACHLKYPASKKLIQNTVQLHMAYSPQIKVIQVLKKQENVQVATILLGTFVSILILIACLYFFSG
ncbi:sialic acid-binding Ig-like lectin 14 isoform X2 [Pantherophis guttatus]|uniref:Sialic acid-binding Ig-like lectin 14 isoform X2 n=1 Tax=Pantherophis guttatus TaxID=94885 RepID=A0A6P9D639_PANGU|nr:sialic acid-binding Ig-like lectin 14 isoform X2 [Pantherophis guttatus]